MSACGFYLARFHHVLDTSGQLLTQAQQQAAQDAGNKFLLVWSKLARDAFDSGLANYKLRPKTHDFAHIVDSLSNRENCKHLYCFMSEDFMGRLARLAASCHRNV